VALFVSSAQGLLLTGAQAWRMLTRSFLPPAERSNILAYSPMLHARLYADAEKYRRSHFEPTKEQSSHPSHVTSTDPEPSKPTTRPHLDGNPAIDRPLFVQFCANDPDALLAAAQKVAPYCDAVDLNLGCPQGIARRGNYGAFLQEDQELIYRLINILHENLSVPVTAKIRILETREKTLAYARKVLAAGASILTVHGRRREQKGHLTGVADWEYIKYLRDNLPPETVLFANGNILQRGDLERCLAATSADGVMSAEGNLSNPAMFAEEPALGNEGREFWRGHDGHGGWRVDAVMRRYLDILWRYVVGKEPPSRRGLFLVGEDTQWLQDHNAKTDEDEEGPTMKKRKKGSGKRDKGEILSPNFTAVQPHLFHLLRHLVTRHTDVRDVLARTKGGDMEEYERLLRMVEAKAAEGMLEYERTSGQSVVAEWEEAEEKKRQKERTEAGPKVESQAEPEAQALQEADDPESSLETIRECRRPWWVVQPVVRPLPQEAVAKGAVTLKVAKEPPRNQDMLKPSGRLPTSAPVADDVVNTAERPVLAAEIGSVA
jgi:tRNA-dihydrouridine synthase 1